MRVRGGEEASVRTLLFPAPLLAVGLALAPCLAKADPACPGQHGQSAPYETTKVTFDSVAAKIDADISQIVNCAAVANAKQEYLIDWSEANLNNVFTQGGAVRSSHNVSGKLTLGGSTVYFGADRTAFTVGIQQEETVLGALKGKFIEAISSFHGSVSTVSVDRPPTVRQEKLQPVEFQATARFDGPEAQFAVSNQAKVNGGGLSIATPTELIRANKEIPEQIPLTQAPRFYTYPIDPKSAVLKTVAVKLRNSDRQEIGTIQLTIVTDRRE